MEKKEESEIDLTGCESTDTLKLRVLTFFFDYFYLKKSKSPHQLIDNIYERRKSSQAGTKSPTSMLSGGDLPLQVDNHNLQRISTRKFIFSIYANFGNNKTKLPETS